MPATHGALGWTLRMGAFPSGVAAGIHKAPTGQEGSFRWRFDDGYPYQDPENLPFFKHFDHFKDWYVRDQDTSWWKWFIEHGQHPKDRPTNTTEYWSGRKHSQVVQAAVILGRKGGHSRSPAKIAAARLNGRLGGRPPGS